MKFKKLVSLILSLSVVSSYAVNAFAESAAGADPGTQLASDSGTPTAAAPESEILPDAPEPDTTDAPESDTTAAPEPDAPATQEPDTTAAPEPDAPTTQEPDTTNTLEPDTTNAPDVKNDPILDPDTTTVTKPDTKDDPADGTTDDTALWTARATYPTPLGYRYYGSQTSYPLPIGTRTQTNYYLEKMQRTDPLGAMEFSEYLASIRGGNSNYTLPTAELGLTGVTNFTYNDTETGDTYLYRYLPTKLSNGNLISITNLGSSGKISLPIVHPVPDYADTKYTAVISRTAAVGLKANGGDVNLALNFEFKENIQTLRISFVDPPDGKEGSVEYKIDYDTFEKLLKKAGLDKQTLSMYSEKGNLLQPIVEWGNNAVFTLSGTEDWGVYYTVWNEEQYITKAQAQVQVDKAIEDLELTTIADLKDQIADLKNQIKALDGKYTTEETVDAMINSYFTKETNLTALVEAIFKNGRFDTLLESKLKEFFSFDSGDFDTFKNILTVYIIGQVTTELKNLDTRLDKLETLISKAIETQLGNIFNSNTTLDSLKDFILGLQLLESLKGKDGADGANGKDGVNGKDGADGEDGEDFAEWAKRNYGSIDNFISRISFEGWAKYNYGSVDNFIRSVSGTNGLSAYDLAVQSGYNGTLGQWLESLRGQDGKSAYELAVENGYNGTERQWLESLQGEDGADGEDGQDGRDGRDGRDANVVYVNGTYGELPISDNASGTAGTVQTPVSSGNSAGGSDVVLTIDPPASSGVKGAAANPATGAAVGLLLPAAAAVSVLLVKKGGRRRGRK